MSLNGKSIGQAAEGAPLGRTTTTHEPSAHTHDNSTPQRQYSTSYDATTDANEGADAVEDVQLDIPIELSSNSEQTTEDDEPTSKEMCDTDNKSVPLYKLCNGRLPSNISATEWAVQFDQEYLNTLRLGGTLPYGIDTTGRGSLALFVRDAHISKGVRLFLETPVVDFLDDATLENCACVCKLWWCELHSLTRIRKRIPVTSSMSRHSRNKLWMLLLAGDYAFCSAAKYMELLVLSSPCDAAILRDVGRTFPSLRYFMKTNSFAQRSLFRLLHAAAVQVPSVGYCQGMNFIAGVLLAVLPNELAAFQCLLGLLCSHDLRSLFRPDLALLKRLLCQLDTLIRMFIPHVGRHLDKHGLSSSFFATSWFLTLFAYEVPMSVALHFLDQFLLRGWQVIFQLALAFLFLSHRYLRNLSFEHTLLFMKNFPRQFCLFEMRLESLISFASGQSTVDCGPVKLSPPLGGNRNQSPLTSPEKNAVARLLRAIRLMPEEQRDDLLKPSSCHSGLDTHFSKTFIEYASADLPSAIKNTAAKTTAPIASAGHNGATAATPTAAGGIHAAITTSNTTAHPPAADYTRAADGPAMPAPPPAGAACCDSSVDLQPTSPEAERAAAAARRVAHRILRSASQFKVTQSMLKELEASYERGGGQLTSSGVESRGPQHSMTAGVIIANSEAYFNNNSKEDRFQSDEGRLRNALSAAFLRRCVPQLSSRQLSGDSSTSETVDSGSATSGHRVREPGDVRRGVGAGTPRQLGDKVGLVRRGSRRSPNSSDVKFKITQHVLLSKDDLVEKFPTARRKSIRKPPKKPVPTSSSSGSPIAAEASPLHSGDERRYRTLLTPADDATGSPEGAKRVDGHQRSVAASHDRNGVLVVDVSRSLNQRQSYRRQNSASSAQRNDSVTNTNSVKRVTITHSKSAVQKSTSAVPTSSRPMGKSPMRVPGTTTTVLENNKLRVIRSTAAGQQSVLIDEDGSNHLKPLNSKRRVHLPQILNVKKQLSRAYGVGRRTPTERTDVTENKKGTSTPRDASLYQLPKN